MTTNKRKEKKMKYKTGQNVDIGDGSVWRIIDIEDDVIEIETVGAVEYETLFVDESEIESEVDNEKE
jgi:hypothetical protein